MTRPSRETQMPNMSVLTVVEIVRTLGRATGSLNLTGVTVALELLDSLADLDIHGFAPRPRRCATKDARLSRCISRYGVAGTGI